MPYTLWREGYIYKLNSRLTIVKHRFSPFRDKGYDHIGGLDFYRGVIYAALEDVYLERPMIVCFNKGLEVIDSFILPEAAHCPWVAVDETGLLYTSDYTLCKVILVYSYVKGDKAYLERRILLDKPLYAVQGGCFYDDDLFLSCDDKFKAIYRVRLHGNTGSVTRFVNTNLRSELEDLYITRKGEMYIIDHEGRLYRILQVL